MPYVQTPLKTNHVWFWPTHLIFIYSEYVKSEITSFSQLV